MLSGSLLDHAGNAKEQRDVQHSARSTFMTLFSGLPGSTKNRTTPLDVLPGFQSVIYLSKLSNVISMLFDSEIQHNRGMRRLS